MADIVVEHTTEPDPAATAIGNDQEVNDVEDTGPSATTETALPAAAEATAPGEQKPETEQTTGAEQKTELEYKTEPAAEVKEDKDENKAESGVDAPAPKEVNHAEIRRQVEFYLSDSNLPTDKFLFEKTGGHKNNPVSLKEIGSFKLMRDHSHEDIVESVKDSKFLVLQEDGESICRKVPLDDRYTEDIEKNKSIYEDVSLPRSIYAKGFNRYDDDDQKKVERFFKPYGSLNAVRLRRHDSNRPKHKGPFKGSVFVEFSTEAEATEFLALDPKPKWHNNDGNWIDLDIKSKKVYVDGKNEDIRNGDVRPRSPRGDRKSDDWRERRDDDRASGRLEGGRGRGGDRGRGDRGGFRGRGDRGRGGRGRGGSRGRGDRGRGGNRGGRDNDRRRDRDGNDGEKNGGDHKEATAPDASKTDAATKATVDTAESNSGKKREREDDGGAGGEAKKVKAGESTEASG